MRLARLLLIAPLFLALRVLAHNVAAKDAELLKQSQGAQIVPFIYLGTKHAVAF